MQGYKIMKIQIEMM